MIIDTIMPAQQSQPVNILNLMQCVIAEQNPQQQQFHRTLTSQYNTNIENTMKNIAEKNSAVPLTNINALRNVSYEMLRPQAATDTLIDINGGWGNKRASIILTFNSNDGLNNNIETLYCYTDNWDVSLGNHMNPETKIYVNKIIVTPEPGKLGSPAGSSTLSGATFGIGSTFGSRPSDLLTLDLAKEMRTDDVSTPLAATSFKALESKNANFRASSYVTDYINSLETAQLQSGGVGGVPYLVADAQSITNGADFVSSNSSAMEWLEKVSGYSKVGYFELGDLLFAYPDSASNSKYTLIPNANPHNYGLDTQGWNVTSTETILAHIIGKAISSLFAEFEISFGTLGFTNETGVPNVSWLSEPAGVYKGISVTVQKMEGFKMVLLAELQAIMLANRVGRLAFTVTCGLTSSTDISISIEGGPLTPFNTPTFTDALTSSLVTNDFSSVLSLADDFSNLVTATSII